MTLREIIYDVLEHLNAYSDDHKFSEEHIAFKIHTKRSLLLTQAMSKLNKEIPLEALQNVCMALEIDENCFQDLKVLKTVNKLPSTINNTGRGNIVHAFAGSRFQKTINIVDYARLPYLIAEQYTDNMLYVATDPNNYLVVVNPKESHLLLEQLEVEAVFENAEEAYAYDCVNLAYATTYNPDVETVLNEEELDPTICDFWDAKYPLESQMVGPIVQMIVKELLIKLQIPIDEINNAEADSKLDINNDRRRRRQTS